MFTAVFFLYALGISYLVIHQIESEAKKLSSTPLSTWRRLFIALPIIFLLAANLDSVLGLYVLPRGNPLAIYPRYHDSGTWNTDRFLYPGLVTFLICPFILLIPLSKIPWALFYIWSRYLVWLFIVYAPLLLRCGVPLRD